MHCDLLSLPPGPQRPVSRCRPHSLLLAPGPSVPGLRQAGHGPDPIVRGAVLHQCQLSASTAGRVPPLPNTLPLSSVSYLP